MIPDQKLRQIRDRAAGDIVEIVEAYVKLKRSGRSWKGLCPFHDEKTPSFHVTPGMGVYKCFGCGEGGDVIDFLMQMEGYDFMKTVKVLAERFHIDISGGKQTYKPQKNIKEAVVPGITEMKYKIRKNGRVYICFDPDSMDNISENTPHLMLDLPVSRGQFKIMIKYADEIILFGRYYELNDLLQSVENALKQRVDPVIIGKNSCRSNWLQYLMSYHPDVQDRIKQIISRISGKLMYELYRNYFFELTNETN